MNIGTGIAIVGIWIGAGAGFIFGSESVGEAAAISAMVATIMIALYS